MSRIRREKYKAKALGPLTDTWGYSSVLSALPITPTFSGFQYKALSIPLHMTCSFLVYLVLQLGVNPLKS